MTLLPNLADSFAHSFLVSSFALAGGCPAIPEVEEPLLMLREALADLPAGMEVSAAPLTTSDALSLSMTALVAFNGAASRYGGEAELPAELAEMLGSEFSRSCAKGWLWPFAGRKPKKCAAST